MTTLAATSGLSVYWYLMRSTGAVALLLLTGAVALGVVDVRAAARPSATRHRAAQGDDLALMSHRLRVNPITCEQARQ